MPSASATVRSSPPSSRNHIFRILRLLFLLIACVAAIIFLNLDVPSKISGGEEDLEEIEKGGRERGGEGEGGTLFSTGEGSQSGERGKGGRIGGLSPDHPLDSLFSKIDRHKRERARERKRQSEGEEATAGKGGVDSCKGKRVFVYDLPEKFYKNLLPLLPPHRLASLSHFGMGKTFEEEHGTGIHAEDLRIFHPFSFFHETSPLSFDLLFHSRMLHWPCQAHGEEHEREQEREGGSEGESEGGGKADIYYVPFYGGILYEISQYASDTSFRDTLLVELAQWLQSKISFRKRNGTDHVMSVGAFIWPFLAFDLTKDTSDHATKTIKELDFVKGMMENRVPSMDQTFLVNSVFLFGRTTDNFLRFSSPPPFHPISRKGIRKWQAFVWRRPRPRLLTVILESEREVERGGEKPGVGAVEMRDIEFWRRWLRDEERKLELAAKERAIVKECRSMGKKCHVLDCTGDKSRGEEGEEEVKRGCSHLEKLKMYLQSQFVIPSFSEIYHIPFVEAMISGAVPIRLLENDKLFDTPGLPDPDLFSVLIPLENIPEWTSLSERLNSIPLSKFKALQKKVVSLIPSVVYRHPEYLIPGIQDAFDLGMEKLFKRAKDRGGNNGTHTYLRK